MIARLAKYSTVFFVWLVLSLFFHAQAEPRPEVSPARMAEPPALDGRLDENIWAAAAELGDFSVFRSESKTADTRVRVAYDDTWLYFGIECRNSHLKILHPKVSGHDKGATADDSVEVFLDPSGAGRIYFHYILSYAGAKDERRVTVGSAGEIIREPEWDMPWPAAVAAAPEGWSAELAIPLYLIASYGDFDSIRLNVARNKRIPVIDANAVIVNESKEASVWAPVGISFHAPEHFGYVRGLRDLTPQIPPLAALADVTVLPYRRGGDGRMFYDVTMNVKAYSPADGEFALVVNDMPLSGTNASFQAQVAIKGGRDQKAALPIPVASMNQRQIEVSLRMPGGLETSRVMVEDLSALKIMDAYLDRNYYTSESNAAVVCAMQLPQNILADMTLKAQVAGQTLAIADQLSPGTNVLRLPLGALDPGRYTANIDLCRGDANPFYTIPVPLIKRPPQPGNEWKIDHVNRRILNNGEPFFPCGLVMSRVAPDTEADFKALADMEFNVFVVWGNSLTPAELAVYHRTAEKYELYVKQQPENACVPVGQVAMKTIDQLANAEAVRNSLARHTSIGLHSQMLQNRLLQALSVDQRTDIFGDYYAANLPRMLQAVELTKGYSNNIGYFIFDEPLADEIFQQTKFGRDFYRRINDTDGYHPVYVNYSSYIPPGVQYVDWFDVLMTDPYWIPAAGPEDGIRGTINFVSYITSLTDRRGAERRQPVVIIPVAERWSGAFKRSLTSAEQICQSYLALIHGAKGLFFFVYPFRYAKTLQTFKALGHQLKALAPCIVAPDIPHRLEYVNVQSDPCKGVFPPIQARLFGAPDGRHLLLAANSKSWPVAAKFTISGLQGEIGERFSERKWTTADNSFQDEFAAFGVRAYVLPAAGNETPREIAVDAQEDQSCDAPESSWTYAGRTGMKNLAPNPGFEEHYPDMPIPYYYCPWIWGQQKNIFLDDGDWVLDSADAFEGKYSLRIRKDPENGMIGLHFQLAPQIPDAAAYTFSVYLKADRPGIQAVLHHGYKSKSIQLTTEWKRYSITSEYSWHSRYYTYKILINARKTGDTGTVWADAVQVERSGRPTEYQP